MNLRNLLQAVLFPLVLAGVNYLFKLIGYEAGGDIAAQLASLIVSALLTLFFGDVVAAKAPKYFK